MHQYDWDVYVSHDAADRTWVMKELVPRLEQAGLKVFVEPRDLDIGVPREKNIERAVASSRHILLVISKSWLKSGWNEFEGNLGGTTDPAGRLRRLIPVLVEACQLPPRLDYLNHADFTGSKEQFDEEMTRLLRGLLTKSRVFLCCAHGIQLDDGLAERLSVIFEGEGHRVMKDRDISVGVGFRQGVHEEIERSDFVVALLSAASLKDAEVLDQIGYASKVSISEHKGNLLPIRVNYLEALPETLGTDVDQLNYALWRNDDDDEIVGRRLLEAISRFTELKSPVARVDEHAPVSPTKDSRLWPKGGVLAITFMDGEPLIQWKVAKAAMEWARYANLRLVFTDDTDAPIRISFKLEGSWAIQATDALAVPKNQPTVNFGWLTNDTPDEEIHRVVLHEFGHVLGLVHEHQIPDAKIPWNRDVVIKTLSGPPNYWTLQQIEQTMFQTYPDGFYPTQKEFDPTSIMAFSIPAEFTDGKVIVGMNMALSDKDKAIIAALYPG